MKHVLIVAMTLSTLSISSHGQIFGRIKEKVEQKVKGEASKPKPTPAPPTKENSGAAENPKAKTPEPPKSNENANSAATPEQNRPATPPPANKPATSANSTTQTQSQPKPGYPEQAPVPSVDASGKKLTYEEKLALQIYGQKWKTNIHRGEPYTPLIPWTPFVDKNGNRYGIEARPVSASSMKKEGTYVFKREANGTFTVHYKLAGIYIDGMEFFSYNTPRKQFVDKNGNFIFAIDVKNGCVFYRADGDGVIIPIAGNPNSYKKVKDGKGIDAKIFAPERMFYLNDDNIYFYELIGSETELVGYDGPAINKTGLSPALLRKMTPEGEVITVRDAANKYFVLESSSYSLVADKKGNIIKADHENIYRLETLSSKAEKIAGNPSGRRNTEEQQPGTYWIMGDVKVAKIPGIYQIFINTQNEIILFSRDSFRFAKVSNGKVTHYSGNSDFTKWFSGVSIGANAPEEKDGTAKTAQIVFTSAYIDGDTIYFLNRNKIKTVDSAGNVKTIWQGTAQ